jgi:predicted dehydrogenase
MRSLEAFPDVQIKAAFDRDVRRLDEFCTYWGVRGVDSLDKLLEVSSEDDIILNLTNPAEHFKVSFACIQAGHHVYSEKPLATEMADAYVLHALAHEKKVLLASAPCSVLCEAAQTLWRAIRDGTIGKPIVVYAELDDDFVTQAPYKKWISESGARWPYADEFRVGCTLEHAGYYLTWLIAMFGSVKRIVATSAELIDKDGNANKAAPDFSVATLFFDSGVVARLTCSIIAPHNHRLRIIGSRGVLELDECWNNSAKVRFRRRFVVRRKLINSPFAKRIRLSEPTHPKVRRRGAAAMNFALGPAEMLSAITEIRPCRMSADFALHLNEVTLAIQNAGDSGGATTMLTRCSPITPMKWALTL